MTFSFAAPSPDAIDIIVVTGRGWDERGIDLPDSRRAQAAAMGFLPKAGRHAMLPPVEGAPALVLFGQDEPTARDHDPLLPGRLATLLPPGVYRFGPGTPDPTFAALSWALSAYRFTRFKKPGAELPRLVAPAEVDAGRLERIVAGSTLGRDLINTPANELGPDALEAAALDLAAAHGASSRVVSGHDLEAGFPLIHAVGKAGHQHPRLVDFTWGDPAKPRVTLVGKGVTFDTGGLNIKPDAGMLLMKKDMGGAAAALALASMVMSARLGLCLRVLLPIVENAIASTSMRPGDIYRSRKGLTVEIGNTDAEGRLILADALTLACEDGPDLILEFATLTGAARVALGPDIPPFFTDHDDLADAIAAHARAVRDPVWRLPLWNPYDSMLDGKISDLNNVGGSGHAGSITAALFLRRFVEPARPWAHFDIFGWNPAAKSGRPEGGEVQAVRSLYDLLESRYPA